MRHPITQTRMSATPPARAIDAADRPRAAQPARALRVALSAVCRRALASAIAAAAIASPAAAAATPPAPRLPAAANVSECQPVAVRATHAKRMEAFCRLSRIDNGTVACLQTDTAKLAKCRFTPSSGRWLESKRGPLYAMVGQAISRDGRPGGRYTVAAKLGKDGRPPCVKDSGGLRASAADMAGTAASQELAAGCVTEVMGSASNVTGLRLQNHATREVCTSSYPHPDGAQLVRRGADGSYCYLGRGAGLNDRYGTERNSMNVYFAEAEYCHVIWSSGAEVPAAKRPATTTYPAPGRVQTNTPIVWRPVSSVPIAN